METFESLESLFRQAILWGDIDHSDDPSIKAITITHFEWEFSIWLQNNSIWQPEAENITRFLTKKNWEQFMGEKALWERRWNKKNEAKTSKKPKYDHPSEIVGLFCNLLDSSKIDQKGDRETVANFCNRICLRFGIDYRDKVRQNFNSDANSIKLNVPKVLRELLPYLNSTESKLFIRHLEENNLTTEGLYG